jgi:carboxyl-terminal processing protease
VGFAQKNMQKRLETMENFYNGSGVGSGSVVLGDPEKQVDISLLWYVWRVLQARYVHPEKLKSDALLYGAVEGLVRGVGDPYTAFMTPVVDKEFRDSLAGNLEGIGAELTDKDGLIVVARPLKGSPAEKAGLKPEDILFEVNGESMAGKTLNEVVTKVRGPKGTTVSLSVIRKGKQGPVALSIVRDAIHIPSVASKTIPAPGGAIGYIELNQFGDQSIDEFKKELQGILKDKNVKGLVIDVRGNGGGYLEGAIDLVSLFLRKGTVVTVEQRGEAPIHHQVTGNVLVPDIPLVVLQDEGSASASEITAGALQDSKRAIIIGKKSFGKGTVQEIINLPGGSSLRVTVARWLTPSGKDLGKEGVHPDIEVQRTAEDIAAQKDPPLDAAVLWLSGYKEKAEGMAVHSAGIQASSASSQGPSRAQ